MIDKKYTDKDIISSLEVIATTCNCNECKIRSGKWGTCNCSETTANAALDLINRQKAEIKELKRKNEILSRNADNAFQECLNECRELFEPEIKAEAYKEFAERLKRSTVTAVIGNEIYAVATSKGVDNLLKEMAGDE